MRFSYPTTSIHKTITRIGNPVRHLALTYSLLLPACYFAVPAQADAAIQVTVAESGNDVVFTASGSYDTTSLATGASAVYSSVGFVADATPPRLRMIETGGSSLLYGISQPVVAPPAKFSNFVGYAEADAFSGDIIGVSSYFGSPCIVVPDGYVSGTSLSATMTYTNESLASLQMNRGDYVWTWGSGGNADSFTLTVIPEPVSTFLAGLVALVVCPLARCLRRYRHRRRSAATQRDFRFNHQ